MGLINNVKENLIKKRMLRKPSYFLNLLKNNKVSPRDTELLNYFVELHIHNKYDAESYVSQLLDFGVDKYYFLNNEKVRNYFIEILVDFFNNDIRWLMKLPFPSISQEMLSNRDIKNQILEKIDVQESGEQLLERIKIGINPEDIKKIKGVFEILIRMGYEPFRSIEDLIDPYQNCSFQKSCIDVGLISSDIVNRAFEYKYIRMKEWVLSNNQEKCPEYYISEELKSLGNSELVKYWSSLDQKCGFDTLFMVLNFFKSGTYKRNYDMFGEKTEDEIFVRWKENEGKYFADSKEYFREHFTEIRGTLFNSNGILNEMFFKSQNFGTMLYDILYYNWEGRCSRKDIHKYLSLFYHNIDKVPEQFQGIIKTWHSIESDDLEETQINRQKFILFATDNHNVFEEYFDTNGPTNKFYHEAKFTLEGIDVAALVSSDWVSHYTKSELRFIKFIKQNQKYFNINFMQRLNLSSDIKYDEWIDILFKDGDLTRELVEILLWSENSLLRELLSEDKELYSLLTKQEKDYLDFYFKYDKSQSVGSITKDNLHNYFDENGATSTFTKLVFDNLELDLLIDSSNSLKIEGILTYKDKLIISEYSNIPDNLKNVYKKYMKDNKDNIDEEKIKFVSELLVRITYSNASELTSHVESLATLLLNDQNPLDKLDKIEQVFIHNNLPEIAKIFLTFQILHPDNYLVSDFKFYENENLSPVLRYNAGDVNKLKNIIFADLMKAAIYSNNRSIRDYVKGIEEGNRLFEEVSQGRVSIEDLTNEELNTLEIFKNHLVALYVNSSKNLNNSLNLTGNLRQDLMILREAFHPTTRYDLLDRLVRMFCFPIGIKSFNELKQVLDDSVREIDLKNRSASLGRFTIQKGDFIKGLGDICYLEHILQNGSVAKEYLGDAATSDMTPLDTDLSRVLTSGTLDESISSSISAEYGPVWIVLKNDSRFNITRDFDTVYQDRFNIKNKYEVFKTYEAEHYGIRTGFPSSFIDYFVVEGEVPEVYLEIVKNGFYIPVVEKKTEKVIFTSEDYDKLRTKMSGLSYYGFDNYQFSDAIDNEQTREIASLIMDSKEKIKEDKQILLAHIKRALEKIGLQLKTSIDGDLTEGYVELIDIGSTGRGTNIPNSGDFDFMLRVDNKIMLIPEKLTLLKKVLKEELHITQSEIESGDFRFKNVLIEGINEPIDLDISFVQRTNKMKYSTDMALEDRLNTIKKVAPEKYTLVLANIILAKKTLKKYGCYKSTHSKEKQGGLGGVGVENWILQNGGSFEAAARSFLEVAEGRNFSEFKTIYEIWDFGENHMADKKNLYKHDNFVNNMNEIGYEKMKVALKEYLYSLGIHNSKESSNITL